MSLSSNITESVLKHNSFPTVLIILMVLCLVFLVVFLVVQLQPQKIDKRKNIEKIKKSGIEANAIIKPTQIIQYGWNSEPIFSYEINALYEDEKGNKRQSKIISKYVIVGSHIDYDVVFIVKDEKTGKKEKMNPNGYARIKYIPDEYQYAIVVGKKTEKTKTE